jgi:EpsI family protein
MKLSVRNLILLALMLAASGMAVALKPTKKISDQGPRVEVESLVPKHFGDWREELVVSAHIVDPRQKEVIDRIYSQTLSRTYVNSNGYRIMLSIAYGIDQSDSMQLHKPEVCYPAQGFTLHGKKNDLLQLSDSSMPVTRVATANGQRREPVTYWTTVGNQVVKGGVHKKLVEMSYGLTGKIPDGMLVRISSIDANTGGAYEMHDRFAGELIRSLAPATRLRVAGDYQ